MKSFDALLGRKSGSLEIHSDFIRFYFDQASAQNFVHIQLNQLQIELCGKNSAHFFLTDLTQPSKIICIQDVAAIQLLADYGIKDAITVLGQSTSKKKIRFALLGTHFAIPFLLIFTLPLLISFIPVSWLDGILSKKSEAVLGKTILLSTDLDPHHPRLPHLQVMIQTLTQGTSELQTLNLKVHISKNSDVNAFALPGENIVINDGLLKKVSSDLEIMGVLAHEIAHIDRRHTVKALVGKSGFILGTVFLGFLISPEAVIWIARGGHLVSLQNSRANEIEADTRGFEILKNAGIPASGMLVFF